jgi:hypothetical protein
MMERNDEEGVAKWLGSISVVLMLPIAVVHPSRSTSMESMIKYTKSVIFTSNVYLIQMEPLVAKRSKATKEAQKLVTKEKKKKREYYTDAATNGWGNKHQAHVILAFFYL